MEAIKISWEAVTADEVCLESNIGVEMGIESDEVVKFSLNDKESELVIYFDTHTSEYAFKAMHSQEESDLLDSFGQCVAIEANKFRTPMLFMKAIDDLIEKGAFNE